ncbi:nucleoside phosphorylase domain-containing protein [Aspergillus aurantiobrunneus]
MRPHTREEFQVAIICALPCEADAAKAIFDETDDNDKVYGKQAGDVNIYVNGRIGQHNEVLSYMPGMGKGSATAVASNLRISYPGVRLVLAVGICGPIISDGVVEYDFGRQYPDQFHRKREANETLGRPNREIQNRPPVVPFVHIGTVACANTVMKSAPHRDQLAQLEGVIGFEMEGAGVWDHLPCVIIKGVCDYADSHKNKIWQPYAAATGAAGAKAFLEHWTPRIKPGRQRPQG